MPPGNTTPIDAAVHGGEFLTFLYHEVRAIARQQLARERPNHTLNTTALVNELYLRLAQSGHCFSSEQEFVPAAAHMIRQILVDYARARKRLKRGGGQNPAALDEIYVEISAGEPVDLESLDEALTRLAEIGERQARVVELRFFAGLSVEETGAALQISPKTVKRDWAMARAWLRARLAGNAAGT
jgi:RNA polymerase sigma-70 factor (ECF subfamily)